MFNEVLANEPVAEEIAATLFGLFLIFGSIILIRWCNKHD